MYGSVHRSIDSIEVINKKKYLVKYDRHHKTDYDVYEKRKAQQYGDYFQLSC